MTDYKLELRARVEALEAAQRPRVFTAEEVAPAVVPTVKESLTVDGSLVERVADAIAAEATSAGIVNDRPARAAILEVAAWMRENDTGHNAVRWLEMEADPHSNQED